MSSGPLLLPNLGGEETRDWRTVLREPRVLAAANLWRLLFSDRASVPEEWSKLGVTPWPEALCASREVAAFDWLDADWSQGAVAWYPSAAAVADPATTGLALAGPAPEVVGQVHDKAFAQRAATELGFVPRALRDTTTIFDPEELESEDAVIEAIERALATWPEWTQARFALKPRIGTSGRGRIEGTGAADLQAVRRGLGRLARQGGAVLEPWLERETDLSAQLRITQAGEIQLLGTLDLRQSRSGSYLGHSGEIDSRGRVFSAHRRDEDVREAAAAIAGRVAAAGFFGPCGVDAFSFRWHDGSGQRESLRPIVEFNARFTMGTIVLGLVRRSLQLVRAALSLQPGDRAAFTFGIDAPKDGWERARDRAGEPALLVPLWSDSQAAKPALLFARNDESPRAH